MNELVFQLLVSLTVVATVAGIVMEEVGSKRLPEPLRSLKAQAKRASVDASKRHPWVGAARLFVVCGYLLSLVALACFVPFSPWAYLLFTVCWSTLSVWDAPHILPRLFVPMYEASLLLNGAILALCFLSPLAARFGAG